MPTDDGKTLVGSMGSGRVGTSKTPGRTLRGISEDATIQTPIVPPLPRAATNHPVGHELSETLAQMHDRDGKSRTKGRTLLKLELTGEANDYVGKGLSGADIVVKPIEYRENQPAVGNTTLYGATSGRLFVAGSAGERFAVRNSGAEAVVEGLGAHGCEYMTGGRVVVLGPVGWNLAAGMSGGELFVLQDRAQIDLALNGDLASVAALTPAAADRLEALIRAHAKATGSPLAKRLIANWAESVTRFVRIVPIPVAEAEAKLDHPEAVPA